MKTISSSMTFFYKYIFSILWSGGFGVGTLLMFISDQNEMPKFSFLTAWILGTTIIYLITGRIKKVDFDGKTFTVSNFSKSITIDVSQVKSVSGSVLLSPELVWFKLKEESGFRKTIIFMPKFRFFSGFSQSPMVEELRQKCDL